MGTRNQNKVELKHCIIFSPGVKQLNISLT